MATHASWKGHLRISLASIPVEAFTVASGNDSSDVSFNQLHEQCKNRIQYKKVCPVHGEVPNDEIVSGYEYAKGQYVVIEKDELSSIAADLEKALTIECFVPPETIGPEYSEGQSYYLVPDGRVGQKPYSLMCQALNQAQLHGIGEMVISRKQRLVRLRTVDKLIVIDILHYQGEIRSASEFTNDIPNVAIKTQELQLAKSLVEQMTLPKFEPEQYADDYSDRVKELIESKLKGRKLTIPSTEQPDVINFMDALRKSVKAIPTPEKKRVAKPQVPMKSTARKTTSTKKSTKKATRKKTA